MKKIDKTNLANISGGVKWAPAFKGAKNQDKAKNKSYFLDLAAVKALTEKGYDVEMASATFLNAKPPIPGLYPHNVYDEDGNVIGDDRMIKLLGNPLE